MTSRSNVDISREFYFRHSGRKYQGVPIIAANMDTVGTYEMARALDRHHLATALHKHYEESALATFFRSLPETATVFYSMGITREDYDKFRRIKEVVGDAIAYVCVDVANGYTEAFVDFLRELRKGYVQHPDAGHAMPSVEPGSTGACESSEPPFINRCQQLDAAGELLNHLLGPLKARSAKPAGQMLRFDQRPFLSGKPVDASMAEEGYAYIPKDCQAGGCRIHVAFHGCRQSTEEIGIRFVTDAGYNGWADSNRIIVLYPQTRSRNGPALGSWKYVMNPKGCWDWWGYTGANYHTRDGLQIKGVAAMVEHLAKPLRK